MKTILLVLLALSSQAYAVDTFIPGANSKRMSELTDDEIATIGYYAQRYNERNGINNVESYDDMARKQRIWQEEMQHQQQLFEQSMQFNRYVDCSIRKKCY